MSGEAAEARKPYHLVSSRKCHSIADTLPPSCGTLQSFTLLNRTLHSRPTRILPAWNQVSRNLKITLAYDGSEFHGWQVQPGLRTVQGTLAECHPATHRRRRVAAGFGAHRRRCPRSGPSRLGQARQSYSRAQSGHRAERCSSAVGAGECMWKLVGDDFHARHSAKAKTYRYRIYRKDICPPFLARYVYHDPYPMNEEAVIRASEHVVGKHDFTSFAASDPERSARMAEAGNTTIPTSESRRIFAPFTPRNGREPKRNWFTLCAEMVSCTTWCEIWWAHSCKWERAR